MSQYSFWEMNQCFLVLNMVLLVLSWYSLCVEPTKHLDGSPVALIDVC